MPVLLVRHAKAGSRSTWDGPDTERPLTSKGWDQAHALTGALDRWPIALVATSPYLRCQQTVSGLAAVLGLELTIDDRLTEGAATAPARAWVDELLGLSTTSVLCSHGDLIPDLVDGLIVDGLAFDHQGSSGEPGCAKGSVWILRPSPHGLIGTYAAHARLVPSPT